MEKQLYEVLAEAEEEKGKPIVYASGLTEHNAGKLAKQLNRLKGLSARIQLIENKA